MKKIFALLITTSLLCLAFPVKAEDEPSSKDRKPDYEVIQISDYDPRHKVVMVKINPSACHQEWRTVGKIVVRVGGDPKLHMKWYDCSNVITRALKDQEIYMVGIQKITNMVPITASLGMSSYTSGFILFIETVKNKR